MNIIILSGHVGQNPQIKTTATKGAKVATLSLATSRGTGDNKTTDWHNLVAWETQAEIIENHVKKGDKIAIRGELTYSKYTDKEGIERVKSEVRVYHIELMKRVQEAVLPNKID